MKWINFISNEKYNIVNAHQKSKCHLHIVARTEYIDNVGEGCKSG